MLKFLRIPSSKSYVVGTNFSFYDDTQTIELLDEGVGDRHDLVDGLAASGSLLTLT